MYWSAESIFQHTDHTKICTSMNEEKQRRMELRRKVGNRSLQRPAPRVRRGPVYAKSYACFTCRTAHKRGFYGSPAEFPLIMTCPVCQDDMVNVGRHFKAPKKSDIAQWKKVKFLVKHGFVFQHVYETREDGRVYYQVDYPKTLEEARQFVVLYASQALKTD
jgi:hypothetical protein